VGCVMGRRNLTQVVDFGIIYYMVVNRCRK
jgi:hypothetical protein